MSHWIRVISANELPPGSAGEFVAEDRIIALFNVDGTFFALDGICPHQGGPLGKGSLNGCVITCPWHGWQYDVSSGAHLTNASVIHTAFPVRVDDEGVWVDVLAKN